MSSSDFTAPSIQTDSPSREALTRWQESVRNFFSDQWPRLHTVIQRLEEAGWESASEQRPLSPPALADEPPTIAASPDGGVSATTPPGASSGVAVAPTRDALHSDPLGALAMRLEQRLMRVKGNQ